MARGWQRDQIRQHIFLGAVIVGLAALTPQAIAQSTVGPESGSEVSATLTLSAGSLGDALFAITNTFGVNIIADERLIEGRQAPALEGVPSADEALERVLEGTGLRASQSTSGAVLIEEDVSAEATSADETSAVDTASDIVESVPVTVVGSKTGATRQEFGASVGYLGAERIRNETISDVEDVFDRTANASTGSSISGAYSIRGVNTDGVAGGLNRSNALASIIVNQVALGVSSSSYVKPTLFDAASAEVLRGPQSSLQGPNALIGSVYINYNRPDFNGYAGSLRAEAGELDTLRFGLMQNVVLAEDTLAARLALETRQSDGDVDNPTTGSDDVRREDEETVRLALRWQPHGNEDLVVDLTYQHNESDTAASAFVLPSADGGDLFDREQPYDVDEAFPSDFDLISLETQWQMNDRWRLTSVTGASEFSLESLFDGDLSAFDLLVVNSFIKEELFSQEFRLNYEGERISALAGIFYSDGDYTSGFSGTGVFPDGMGGVAPFNRVTNQKENIEQQAVFGQLSWRPVYDWELTVGARFNHEERDTDDFADNNGAISDLSASESFDQFIPSFTIAHDLNDATRIGASYSRGFQAGGTAFAVFQAQATPYDEEFIDNYELFLRYQSLDGRLVVNGNLFYFDWSDQQVTTTLPGGVPGFDNAVVNAGKSEVTGAELELEWRATERVSLFTSVGIVDSEFKTFVVNGVDLAGRSLPQSPDLTATLGGAMRANAASSQPRPSAIPTIATLGLRRRRSPGPASATS